MGNFELNLYIEAGLRYDLDMIKAYFSEDFRRGVA